MYILYKTSKIGCQEALCEKLSLQTEDIWKTNTVPIS